MTQACKNRKKKLSLFFSVACIWTGNAVHIADSEDGHQVIDLLQAADFCLEVYTQ